VKASWRTLPDEQVGMAKLALDTWLHLFLPTAGWIKIQNWLDDDLEAPRHDN